MAKHCWVVVLGDFGRSPRMQYHTVSLSKTAGYTVHVVAYGGATPIASITDDPQIVLHLLPRPPELIGSLPRLLALIVKAAQQALVLLWTMLFRLPSAQLVLLQCPPAVPTIALCLLACWLRASRLIIDWHNFGYSLMALSMRPGHPLVRISYFYERGLGRLAHHHLCVTRAMQDHLLEKWHIPATVVYDSPPGHFRPATLKESHELLMRMQPTIDMPMHVEDCCVGEYHLQDGGSEATICTERTGTLDSWREGRPAMIVSSTSWTPDEDFGILLDAAEEYDRRVSQMANCKRFPRLLIIVTGRGPMKEAYCKKMAKLKLSKVAFRTAWLQPEDYPLLLGSADLGVSLHTSSSGLDLPMKVVDMFGCGLPVCSADYSCIQELVTPGDNGLLFQSPQQLADRFQVRRPPQCCLKGGGMWLWWRRR